MENNKKKTIFTDFNTFILIYIIKNIIKLKISSKYKI